MNFVITASAVVALLGSALIGGVFFAFSSFVMKALARVPSHEGIAAMQSINVVVLNPSFLGVFMGTTVISVLVAALAIKGWATPPAHTSWRARSCTWSAHSSSPDSATCR